MSLSLASAWTFLVLQRVVSENSAEPEAVPCLNLARKLKGGALHPWGHTEPKAIQQEHHFGNFSIPKILVGLEEKVHS